ncbi:sensor histidine kinase [Treponema sp.]
MQVRDQYSPLATALQVLGVSLFLHLLAALQFYKLHPLSPETEAWRGQFVILISISLLLSIRICLLCNKKYTQLYLVTQLLFLCMINYPEMGNFSLAVILFAIPLIESSLLPKHVLWISILIPLLALVSSSVHPLPFWDEAREELAFIDFVSLLIILSIQFFVAHRIRRLTRVARAQEESIQRLNSSMTNLLDANLDFQTYAAEIGAKSTIEERKRLTREVHDIVGYTLINLRMMLEAAFELTGMGNDKLKDLLERAREQAKSGLMETRSALRNFRAIDSTPLDGANRIQQLIKSFSQATGIGVDINYGNTPSSFGSEIDGSIVRIIQESMTNAFRHGKATQIQVSLWIADKILSVKIIDNGSGSSEVKPGIGLSGMMERMDSLQGSLSTKSTEYGFVVNATIPLIK